MNNRKRHVVGVPALLLGLTIAGCQSYQPRALDLQSYREAWQNTDLADDSVAAFAEELVARDRLQLDPFEPADGLTLAEAEAVALLLNPRLRTLRMRAEAPLVGARETGRWDDPRLSFDVMRILSSVQHPWILGGGLGLTLPLSGRLAVERKLAWAEYSTAWREATLAEWQLLNELQAAWLHWSASQRQVALLRAYLDRLQPVEAVAAQLVEIGELPATDARVLRMEVARRQVDLQQQEAHVERERVELLAMLGLAPDAPVQLVPASELIEADSSEFEADVTHAVSPDHPQLLLAEAEYAATEQQLHREIRRQYPDLTLGPVAEREDGQTKLGLGGGVPIPLWNRNTRGIKQAEAARDAARIEAEAVVQELTHRLAALRRQWRSARARRLELERTLSPLADEQMRELEQLIELGEMDVLRWQDALVRSLETKQAILEAALHEASAIAALNAMVHPRWASAAAQDAPKEHD